MPLGEELENLWNYPLYVMGKRTKLQPAVKEWDLL